MSGSSGRKPLVAGNWKMHNNHLEALALTQQLAFRLNDKDFAAVDIVILPPFTALRSVQTLVQGDKLKLQYGAQDVSPHADGAYTGDISGRMLAKLGCRYVLAGHSERRQYHHEGDELINAKVKAVFANEMTPVLCIGESLTVRDAGEHLPHCTDQVDAGLAGLTGEQIGQMVIAYEPIWAIGTGQVASPEDAQEVCAASRERVSARHGREVAARVRILYGGSVNPDNMPAIMAQSDIDGALVGGASLDYEGFVRICRYQQVPR